MDLNLLTPSSQLPDDGIHIYLIDLDKSILSLPGNRILSNTELQRAAKFKFDSDRDRYLRRRCALNILLAGYLNISPLDLNFKLSPSGKPFIPGNPIYFNLSESCGQCVMAFAKQSPLGIDIEQTRPMDDCLVIAERYFSKIEVSALERLEGGERLRVFFHIWTQKEAIVKAIGAGLSFPLDVFDVDVSLRKNGSLIEIRDHSQLTGVWFIKTFTLPGDYQMALCYQQNQPNIKIINI
jgi:4'-phosphopantetheinyl transferase